MAAAASFLRRYSIAGMRAFSVVSQAKGEVHPQALAALHRAVDACPVLFGLALKALYGLSDPTELHCTPT
tara:strand:- start:11527 stop:11736 length:210 start_codon:yes stop_codon:yes gene_type:complete